MEPREEESGFLRLGSNLSGEPHGLRRGSATLDSNPNLRMQWKFSTLFPSIGTKKFEPKRENVKWTFKLFYPDRTNDAEKFHFPKFSAVFLAARTPTDPSPGKIR